LPELEGLLVAVLATDGYDEATLAQPVRALQAAGARVEVVAPYAGAIAGSAGAASVVVDRLLHEARADEYDALLLPGGALSADALRMRADVQRFVRDVHQTGKPIAAIGHAPWLLVSTGLVPGRTLTGYFSIQDDVRNAGGTWGDQAVVEDRNWVTSRDGHDLPAFAEAMVALFARSARSARLARGA
jgi:protease I